MKVFLHYEDNEDTELHKVLKITLPKSWKTGPVNKLVDTFVESYNGNEKFANNKLDASQLHMSLAADGEALASDAVILDVIPDRAEVYIKHGAAQTLADIQAAKDKLKREREEELKNTVQCVHFGCKKRFPRGGPYPTDCVYHKSPPVFHETAKFWSCCPNKKAYDFEDFENIPGCQTGVCSEVRDDEGKMFLGGTDLREQAGEAAQLKSIDDFNKAQASGEAAPVLERLERVVQDLGVEKELFDQVVEGIKKHTGSGSMSDKEALEIVKRELGKKLKDTFKAMAAEQLRIK